MGCFQSKETDVDFGELDIARSEKQMKEGSEKSSSLLHHLNSPMDSLARQAKPVMDNFIQATPKLTDHIYATKAVALGNNPTARGAHHLKNVFAPPLEDPLSFTPPVFQKTMDEKLFIREALKSNFVFAALSERELRTIVDAFEAVDFKADEKLIVQGDVGDFFYVLRKGTVRFEVNDKVMGHAGEGKSFGELALLYTCPRAASVIAESKGTLYRVDQKTFRYIMQSQTLQTENDKKDLLKGVKIFSPLDPTDINKLVHTMVPRVFEAGEYIVKKGEEGDTFYVIQEGKVRVTDITMGSTKYEDQVLGPGDYFGERALVHKEPRSANCIGKTNGIALSIDKETFEKVVGSIALLTMKAEDARKLSAIRVIQMTHLSQPTLGALAAQFIEKKFPPKTDIITEGKMTGAALYFVRSGKVDIKSKSKSDQDWNRSVDAGGYFGEEMLELDVGGLKPSTNVVAQYTAKTPNEPVVMGILTLVQCRSVIDTTTLGKQKQSKISMNGGDSNIPLDSLKRHKILGAGTFGQVWLVSHDGSDGQRRPYALKIQSKYELINSHQAKGVVQEKNIMQQLHHPFLINLVQTYQDKEFIYMLVGLVQGGELFSLLHQTSYDGISEKDAKFYAAGILEGLSHMHRRNILYRDLKPENVLIDRDGYPVIIDFGFAKYVVNKTYTLCGTPLYLAPEVILNRGHDKGADHWSYATLLYEMIAGRTPFYTEGMDQIQLFRTICKVSFSFPPAGVMSMEVEDLIQRFFVLDPAKRLGSLARGINEIYAHTWYSEIDFDELRQKEIAAPWTPTIKDPLDTANFESWDHLEDKTKTQNPFISEEQQRIFKSF